MFAACTVFKIHKNIALVLTSIFIISLGLMLSGCYRLYTSSRFTTPAFFVRLSNYTETAANIRVVWEGVPGSGWEKKFFLKSGGTFYKQGRLTIFPGLMRIAVEISGCGLFSFPNFEKKESSRLFVDLKRDILGNVICKVNVEYANTLVSNGFEASNIYSPR